jgi:hypothetical protein
MGLELPDDWREAIERSPANPAPFLVFQEQRYHRVMDHLGNIDEIPIDNEDSFNQNLKAAALFAFSKLYQTLFRCLTVGRLSLKLKWHGRKVIAVRTAAIDHTEALTSLISTLHALQRQRH